MTKKIKLLIIFTVILGVISACGNSKTEIMQTTNTLEKTKINEKAKPPKSSEKLDEKDKLDSTAAYVKYFNSYLPVSFIKNGQEVLKGDGGWYFDVESRVSGDIPELSKAKIYPVKDMYSDGTTAPYDKLPQTGSIDSRVLCESMAIIGNWDPFPVKVRYESYTLENQPKNEVWLNYFNKEISKVSDRTPVIITEAWFFDLNGDGIEEAFVNANNTFYSTEDNKPNPPFAESSAVYAISRLFLNNSSPSDIGVSFIEEMENKPLNEQKNIDSSYQISEESPEWSEHFVTAIQYDQSGNLIKCPIFNCGEYDRSCEQEIIICDIDGDKQAELITMQYSIYSPIIIYHLNEDGKLVESFRITTPA